MRLYGVRVYLQSAWLSVSMRLLCSSHLLSSSFTLIGSITTLAKCPAGLGHFKQVFSAHTLA